MRCLISAVLSHRAAVIVEAATAMKLSFGGEPVLGSSGATTASTVSDHDRRDRDDREDGEGHGRRNEDGSSHHRRG